MTWKGRGAGSNLSGRFEKTTREADDYVHEPELLENPRTIFLTDHSRTALTRNSSPDIPFDVSINPYRGCEHGCAYCYARPTHEFLGMSAGLDFETKILVKHGLSELLKEEISKKSYVPEVINISGVTDCYQPAERKYKITRSCLEVLSGTKHPFTIVTKNALVTRDIDLIAPMAKINAAAVFITITSLNPDITATLEPRTSRPEARLEAIRKLSAAGIYTGVLIAPVVPGITDSEMPKILEAVAEAGASSAAYVTLRLPLSVAPLFEEWLGKHFPDRKEKVLNRIRDLRGGKLNDPNFNSRMRGEGEFADLFSQMFHSSCRKFGLNQRKLNLTTEHFEKPGEQLGLSF